MKRDLSFKPTKEIVQAVSFKVIVRDTEFIFDDIESAKIFKVGYERGASQREPLSHTKPYRQGYQVGSNEKEIK